MSKKQTKKLMTPEIFHQAVIGSFVKLNPRYMMKNPVMFVVEVGCFITLLLSFLSWFVWRYQPAISGYITSLSAWCCSLPYCSPTSPNLWLKVEARHRRQA